MSLNTNTKNWRPFPYEIKFVDSETNEQLLKDFTGEKTGFVQVGTEKWFFKSKYLDQANHYYNFEARQDDTWVVTFPRSGTTRTQELVWLIANNFNYEAAKKDLLKKRFPFFEFSICIHEKFKTELLEEHNEYPDNQAAIQKITKPGYEFLSEMSSPRFIKTHFPFSLLPPTVMENNSKVIYIARNPKDVAVSYYHLNRFYRNLGYVGDFTKYWNYFESNLGPWMPYWTHIKEGWSHRNHPNVLFMFYEDMNKDLPGAIKKVASFLEKSITDEQIETLSNYLTIENFRNNPAINCVELQQLGIVNSGVQGYIRKGNTGGCSQEFTPELNERADRWIELNLKDTDLKFP